MSVARWFAPSMLVIGLVVAGCGSAPVGAVPAATRPAAPDPAATDAAAPDPASSAPVPSPTAPAGPEHALPIYYVAETAAGFRLQREFHRVAGTDAGSDAVRELFAAPTGIDPDYRNPWPAGTRLLAPVTAAGGVVTVDLTGLTPGAQVGSEGAEMAVQQLVYTVQGALQSTDPVRILVDGEPADLFGTVSTAEPVARGDGYATRSLVQIDSPAHGAVVGRSVAISGEAAVFEATLPWEVSQGGVVVRSGVATTAEGQRFAPFAFTLDLPPGEYVVRITEDDPSAGEGRPVMSDDKTITVI